MRKATNHYACKKKIRGRNSYLPSWRSEQLVETEDLTPKISRGTTSHLGITAQGWECSPGVRTQWDRQSCPCFHWGPGMQACQCQAQHPSPSSHHPHLCRCCKPQVSYWNVLHTARLTAVSSSKGKGGNILKLQQLGSKNS